MDEEIFISSLKGLEGIKIGLFLSDNQFIEGTLLSVQEDHLTVEVEGKTFYFPINQIKAVSKSAKDNTAVKEPSENEVAMDEELLENKLNSMLKQWVTINSFNNQSFNGVLHRISSDYVVLLNGEMQYFIRKDHVINIFQGFLEEANQQDENNNVSKTNNEQSAEAQNVESSKNPQSNEADSNSTSNDTPSEKNKKMDRKKHHDSIQLREVKFNAPMQGCTWNTRKKHRVQEDSDLNQNSNVSPNLKKNKSLEMDKPLNSSESKLPVDKAKEKHSPNNVGEVKKEEVSNQPTMTMEDNRLLMEKQYYALMKFAESMHSLEKQYQALMKHAEKMYLELRKKRKH